MRWLTPIILIVVLLTAACGHDPGGKDKIAVIDWDKAFSAHPKQTVLKQGEAELQKLLRYREEQAEIAKTQIAGLTRLQQLKQNSKANFLDAGFQTQMYAAEAKERKKLLDAYDAAVKEADSALAEQEKELEDAYQLKILNLRLRLEAIKMRPAEREVVQNELNQVQSEREQQRQQILAEKNKIIGAKMEPLVAETQARLKQHAEQLQQEMQGDMSGVLSKDQSDLAKVPEALTKAMAAIDKQADKLQESNEKLRAGIRNDIESNVIKLAHERQYTIVFHSVKVNIKADDITDDVVKALQNMK
ncbi:OmpH family outer membrane protein [Phascolarctobacterium faecium]|uniref:OmpH family outer membrane protein n=1 Tax=Phascolarctobacterium faecium TaxID=33025 RepID=UPI001658DCF3|nr:OmpH family outer membrane protein [Phascolarctobacterium faecium]QNP77892.1 OmpH family outer membrane protein [Phascolarctobacterium faecium]